MESSVQGGLSGWNEYQKTEKQGPDSIECPKFFVKSERNWGRLVKLYGTNWEQDLDFLNKLSQNLS